MSKTVEIPGVFHLEGGGTLHDPVVAFDTWGDHRTSATLICHALTGDQHADIWWSGLFGSGEVFDPSTRFVVSMNVLGGCSGTTGPENGRRGSTFPSVTIRDMVHLQKRVLDTLNVEALDLVIGGSMGGMQTLEWALLYPSFVKTIVPIGVGEAQSAWAIALSEAQRNAIVTDVNFRNGRYRTGSEPVDGLSTARMIAMCSYRSQESFSTRFGRDTRNDEFAVRSYLQHQGQKLTERFDANSYLALLNAMDSHDVGRDRCGAANALKQIAQRCLFVGISSDVLYPLEEVRATAAQVPSAHFATLSSTNGHDAFLIDTDDLGRILANFLRHEDMPQDSRHDLRI